MKRTALTHASFAIFAAGAGALALAHCSGEVPIGQNPGDGGDDSTSASSSGGSGSSSSGSSSGSTSSSSSGSASSSGASSSSGGGGCCPATWNMYTCTYPDGGAGYACHNPALGCASSNTCGVGCDTPVPGVCGGSSSSSSGGSGLTWYFTCGDPVCQAPSADAGGLTNDAGAPCPAIGSGCSVAGQTCGTRNPAFNCGAVEQCAAHDPTMGSVGCPRSSRKFKESIAYVSDEGLQQLHDETLRLQLATYNYKPGATDPDPRHLGFIIEDVPPASPAVGWSRERVDLYGYLSMVVATMQVQEKEIAELRRELSSAKGGACR